MSSTLIFMSWIVAKLEWRLENANGDVETNISSYLWLPFFFFHTLQTLVFEYLSLYILKIYKLSLATFELLILAGIIVPCNAFCYVC